MAERMGLTVLPSGRVAWGAAEREIALGGAG
jgi:hypothetical protein